MNDIYKRWRSRVEWGYMPLIAFGIGWDHTLKELTILIPFLYINIDAQR